MKFDLNNPNLIDRFLVSNEHISKRKFFGGWFILITCVTLYLLSVFIQARFTGRSNLNGIIAQLQVLFSISMVVGTVNPAYLVAFSLNILNAGFILLNYIRTDNPTLIPGIIVPLITIIILATIRMYEKGVNAKIKKNSESE